MRMRVQSLFLVLFLLLSVSAGAQTFVANLNGANEVPPADPDGTGTATVTLVGTTVNYTINVANITLPPVGQHIHLGAAGVNGPIVIALTGTWVGGTLVGSTTTDNATANAIITNPAGWYVNVHTTDFPGGAIRGQLAFAAGAATIPTTSFGALLMLAAVLCVLGLFVVRRI